MDKEKAIEAITKWFKANYEINIDYSTMIITIKEKQRVSSSSLAESSNFNNSRDFPLVKKKLYNHHDFILQEADDKLYKKWLTLSQ